MNVLSSALSQAVAISIVAASASANTFPFLDPSSPLPSGMEALADLLPSPPPNIPARSVKLLCGRLEGQSVAELLLDSRFEQWQPYGCLAAAHCSRTAANGNALLHYSLTGYGDSPLELHHVTRRTQFLYLLGLWNDKQINRVLEAIATASDVKAAITSSGAAMLLRDWNAPRMIQVASVRGQAALGLVLTQDDQLVEVAKGLYQIQLEKVNALNGATDFAVGNLLHELTTAVAANGFIRDHGVEMFLDIYPTLQGSAHLGPYLDPLIPDS